MTKTYVKLKDDECCGWVIEGDEVCKEEEVPRYFVESGTGRKLWDTGSGKTTLVNAIIDKMVEFTPDDRFYIVEDASEIKCHAKDLFPIWADGKDCLKAVGTAMRCNVSRIIFGELRYGDVTNELLKAWNSGHTGGITTVHANSALTMISRIRDLLREVIPGELPDVAQSVQLLVHMIPTRNGPIVNEVVETSQMSGSSFIEELESNNLI